MADDRERAPDAPERPVPSEASATPLVPGRYAGPSHAAPYALSRLAPPFDLVDLAREIERADTTLGWTEVDPISARLVGAALMGIGVQSLLGRDETLEAFRGMLNLKIIWSATATVGIAVSVLQGGPKMGWAFVGIFAAFNVLWTTYRVRLRPA